MDNLSTCGDDTNTKEVNQTIPDHLHPLLNNVILQNLLQYLNFNDHLEFRQVCGKWLQVSDLSFWTKCRVEFQIPSPPYIVHYTPEKGNKIISKKLKKFKKLFPPPGMPTSALKISGSTNHKALHYLLLSRGYNSLTDVSLQLFCLPKQIPNDLDDYLSPNLVKLELENEGHGWPSISLEKLPNIKYLNIKGCSITMNGRITPKKIIFHQDHNNYIYKGEKFGGVGSLDNDDEADTIPLNKMINFSEIEFLELTGEIWELDISTFAPKLHHLNLDYTLVLGWAESRWVCNHLHFGAIELWSSQRFRLSSIPLFSIAQLDMFKLPPFIESLHINVYELLGENIDKPISVFNYPNLRCLTLKLEDQFPPLDFSPCTVLNLLQLNGNSLHINCKADLDRLQLPSDISILKVKDLIVRDYLPTQLDTVVFDEYFLSDIQQLEPYFKANTLLVFLSSKLETEEDLFSLVHWWRYTDLKILRFGTFFWKDDENPFENSHFSKIVDYQGEYYHFEQGVDLGKRITESQFRYNAPLDSHEDYRSRKHVSLPGNIF